MSYLLAFLGFIALIILHEAGHFVAAKATGMRVERFSLFFPPTIFKVRRGETEYALGSLPLGGYVKITGMNPNEELPDSVRPRAYYNQPVWKRVVTIAAGPAVNILIAFAIVWGLIAANGVDSSRISTKVAAIDRGSASVGKLRAGDRVVSIDGIAVNGNENRIRNQVDSHRCAGPMTNGCVATAAGDDRGRPRRARCTASRSGRGMTPSSNGCWSGVEFGAVLTSTRAWSMPPVARAAISGTSPSRPS